MKHSDICKKLPAQLIMTYFCQKLAPMVLELFQTTGLDQSMHKQYVSINGFDSGLSPIDCGAPQNSISEHLLFFCT